MPGAIFAINQDRDPGPISAGAAGIARRDLWRGRRLRFVCTTENNSSYAWSILSAPAGSFPEVAVLNAAEMSFTPTATGPYRIQLVTNGGGPGNSLVLIAYVTCDEDGATLVTRLYPAYGEVGGEANWDDNTQGWATTVSTTFEELSARIAVLEGGGGGGSSNLLIFSPGAPTTGNTYGTEAELATAFAATTGIVTILFDTHSGAVNLGLSWDFEYRAILRSNSLSRTVTTSPSVVLAGVRWLHRIGLVVDTTALSPIVPSLALPSEPFELFLDEGTTLGYSDIAYGAVAPADGLYLYLRGASALAGSLGETTGRVIETSGVQVYIDIGERCVVPSYSFAGSGDVNITMTHGSTLGTVFASQSGPILVSASYAGDWKSIFTYLIGTVVTRSGNLYMSKTNDNVDHVPPNATYWAAL